MQRSLAYTILLVICDYLFVVRFANVVSGTRTATIENVTRRAARAAGERRDESDDESDASAAPDVDSDDDEVPYNPKNLPLGWDGKVMMMKNQQ